MLKSDTTGRMGDLPPVHKRALEWLTLLTSGNATDHDLAAMERWRDESPEHAEALKRQAIIVEIAKSRSPIARETLRVPFHERAVTRRVALGGAVTVAAGYAVVSPPLQIWPSLAELSSDYRTAVGERKRVQLADGLSIQLNTGTSVSLKNAPGLPGIDIVNGEIAVDAALPGSMQFAAYMPEGRVLARDASFDVRKTERGFKATCVRGQIKVEQNGQSVEAEVGQEVVCYIGASRPGAPGAVDVALATAWRSGQLFFSNAPLRAVVAEINRYRRGRIIIVRNTLGDQRISANFSISHLDEAVSYLASYTRASTANLPGGLTILA
jgi:transmembrane sensor